MDTIGTQHFVRYSKVSLTQGLPVKVVDPEGIPKNVFFQLLHETPYLRTSYRPSSQVFTPIAK